MLLSTFWPLPGLPFLPLFALGTFWNLAASLAAAAEGGPANAALELPGAMPAGGTVPAALALDLLLLPPASSAALRLQRFQRLTWA